MVSGSSDHSIIIWETETFQAIRTLKGHTASVFSVAVIQNLIISASADKTIKIWNAETGACLHTLCDHMGQVVAVAPLPYKKFATSSEDRTIKIWDLETATCINTINCQGFYAKTLKTLKDGNFVSVSNNGVNVWRFDSQELTNSVTSTPLNIC